jgi:hypothetical protein
MSRRFDEEAKRLREQLESESLTPAELEQGWQRLRAPRPPRRKLGVLAPAIAIAAIILLVILQPEPEPISENGLVIASGEQCVHQDDSEMLVVPCSREVELSVGHDAKDLRLRRGRARFVVKKRPATKQPFTIAVSHGWIVVIGTRFTVEQERRAGRIEVEEGLVEFRWSDGSPSDRLPAGSSLAWPRRDEAQPATATTTPDASEVATPKPKKKTKPVEKQISAKELMARLFQLKSQRRFDEAIELLAEGSKRKDFSEAQRERLSYELGVVLRQSGRTEEACRHFSSHLRRFPNTSRRKEIADTCP